MSTPIDLRGRRFAHPFAAISLFAALAVSGAGQAVACPDWRQNGAILNFSSDELWSTQSMSMMAGGGANLTSCPMPGIGWIAESPDFTLHFSGNDASRRDLEIRVEGTCDTTLLVNDAEAEWHFSDDEDGTLDPRIRLRAPQDGIYDIWVGTIGEDLCSAVVTLETF